MASSTARVTSLVQDETHTERKRMCVESGEQELGAVFQCCGIAGISELGVLCIK